MKKVFMKAGNRTLSKRLFSIMLIIGILFSIMPDATYADNSGRPPDAIEQEDTEDTESEMSDNKTAEPEQNSESDEMTQDESNYQNTQAQDVQTEDDESNHDNEVMATSNGQSAIMTHTGQTDYMMVSSKSGEYDRYSSDKPNYARLVKFIPSFTSVYYISSVVPYSFDTYGRLYDRNMSSLTSDDDSAGNGQFKLTYRCEAGKTYYIAAGGYTNSSDTRSLAVSIVPSIYAILYNTGELHFQYGETADPAKGSVVGTYQVASSYSAPYQIPWLQKNTSIVKVTSDYISCSVGGITSMSYWFESCRNLANVDVSKIDTSNVRNMSDMFSNCPKLTNLNLSNLNTSNVTNMSGMFDSCSNLTSLNLSSFNTSNVTNMNRMFAACSNLTSLDLSKFNTSNVTDMSGMFNYCLKLTSLDLSKFNTSKVTNMSYMFYCCLKLTILDVSSLDTSKVTDMSNMFRKCSNLKIINLRDKFSTESLKSCNNIFTDTTADLLCDGNKKNAFPAEAYDYGKYIVRGPEFVYTGSQIVENNLQSMVLKPYKKDVKFDANGGTGTITIHVGVNDAIFCNAKYWSRMNICNNLGSFDDGMDYSYPTKSFYTFMGFFTQDGKELLNVNLITEDVYYAHWTPTNYSISYSLNGGSLSGQKTSYNIETANFTLPTPSKSGYTFTGWTGSNGTTAQKSVTITKGSTGNRSYTANWTPTNYTISYNANGGSLSGQKTSYNIETANFTLPQPTRSGYTFTGWTGTGLSSATKSVTVSKGSTGNRSYTANWSANGYTVSFNYNKPSTATGTMSGNGTTSKGVTYATAYGTLPQPSIPGWAFNGWYTAASGGSGISATTTYTAVGNQTLYAHWTLNTYSISYNANGGSLSGQKTSYNVNTDSFTLPTPTKNGYTFTGWTGSNGTTAQKSVTIAKGSTGNKSYTAHWTPVNYTISYNANGGSLSGQKTSYNIETANFTLPTPTRAGYTFAGWTGTGLSSATKSVTVSKGSTGNRSYTANWIPNGYILTFNYNKPVNSTGETMSGNGTVNKGVSYNAGYGVLPTPAMQGWTFNGWYTAASGGNRVTNTTKYTIVGNQTLYAQWTINTYTINYSLNGGSISGQRPIYNIETATFTLPTPTRNGYTFTGWTGSNGTTAQKTVTITKGSTGNKSYTANWTPTNYSIGYTLNGGSISGQRPTYNIETATFTLPTPSKSGYTFTGWTGTGLSGLTKTVTVSKGSTGNRTYTAHFEKTVTATFKYYNNQTVTVTGKITDSATSVAVKGPTASGTPSGYTFRGWSTSSAANASVNATASASVTISANVTYYASYSKNVTATFYYCTLAADNYTYVNGAQGSAAASATQYLGYTGTVVNSNIAIPSAVTASHGGASAQNYVGVSKDTNSVSTVTPTTAYTKYYAVYTEPLKFYYYNGTNDTSTSVTRRMLSNGSAYSNSLSASAPAPAAYDGAAFAWWSCDSGVSGSSSLRKPLETGVNSLYAVYKKNVSISYNANGGQGAPAAQSGTKYYAKKESGSNIANPSITVTGSKPSRSGYNFSSWNTSANGSGTVYKAGTAYTVSANVTIYAQWSYNSVSVKIPQILIANHAGTSQFRVKCDDFKAGNIKISVPNSFLYKQTGKADVTAAITSKSGNNIITSSNKVCVYSITTTNGLSAGCWQGSFNIGLTLTKE